MSMLHRSTSTSCRTALSACSCAAALYIAVGSGNVPTMLLRAAHWLMQCLALLVPRLGLRVVADYYLCSPSRTASCTYCGFGVRRHLLVVWAGVYLLEDLYVQVQKHRHLHPVNFRLLQKAYLPCAYSDCLPRDCTWLVVGGRGWFLGGLLAGLPACLFAGSVNRLIRLKLYIPCCTFTTAASDVAQAVVSECSSPTLLRCTSSYFVALVQLSYFVALCVVLCCVVEPARRVCSAH
jgi:hypothetical protein